MATWSLTAQLTSGTLALGATDRIWWNGANFGDNVVVGSYQDSTHVSNSDDVHQCSANHVHNTKYVDDSHYILDGGSSTAFDVTHPTTSQCGLKFTFTDASSVSTSGGKFYVYDGITETSSMAGVHFQAFQADGTIVPAWVDANGSGSALSLANQTAATSHDFYIGTSVSPTSSGAKSGKIKIVVTYV
jgi:hypothetical protein